MSWVVEMAVSAPAAAGTAAPAKRTAAVTVPARQTAQSVSAPACRRPGLVTVNRNIAKPPLWRGQAALLGIGLPYGYAAGGGFIQCQRRRGAYHWKISP